ncbi:MAG: amidase domain-containing protein [Clostridia bacterium]|nr:amidase domain-containing protein [Clostridia bacterium]
MRTIEYNRQAAVEYARRWAYARNPKYFNFNSLGGDCTNFASQCLFAGAPIMNTTPTFGWFYRSLNDRSPAWTGVEFFYRFLTGNAQGDGIGNGVGPFAQEVDISELEIGDFVQLGSETGDFYHTPVVVGFSRGAPLLAAHTYDAYNRPLTSYGYARLRCLHILGVKTE